MKILDQFSELRRGTRRPAGKATRTRLALEPLEERSLLSANFFQTNLVSDLPGVAQIQDPTLVNPWGISLSPAGGAFWVSATTTGLSQLYLGDVNGSPITQPFKVVIPGESPTGQVFNPDQPVMGT